MNHDRVITASFRALLVLCGGWFASSARAQDQEIMGDLTLSSESPQLTFNDNSNPAHKWQIWADDSFFDFIDIAPGQVQRLPVRFNFGAPSFSLVVDGSGRIGTGGVQFPATELHTRADVAPTLRLEQSGNGTDRPPQTWEMTGSDFSFSFRNLTRGGFPFWISSHAPDNSLVVDYNANLGVGTNLTNWINGVAQNGNSVRHLNLDAKTGLARSVVQGDAGAESWLVHRSGLFNRKAVRTRVAGAKYLISTMADNTASTVESAAICIDLTTTNVGVRTSTPLKPFQVGDVGANDGNGAHVTHGGVWTNASSRSVKQDIRPITSEQARDTVRALQPVGYRYKNELDETYIGFIAEDVPDLVATRDRKSLASMDITAVLTKVVQDQDRELTAERQRNDRLERLVETLMRRVNDIEQQRDSQPAADR